MYFHHFGFKTEPFSSSPDPEFLWMGAKHAKALETLKEGILERDGCVLLTGDIGTGKTALVKRFVDLKEVAAMFITVSGPELNALAFFNILASEFGINRRFDSREEFLSEFKLFLLQNHASSKKVMIILDEAQRLNPDILKEAVVLSNLSMAGRKLVKIFFVGQLDFDEILKQEENRHILENITARFCLEPLTEEETRSYIEHRLKVAGRDTPVFSPDAIHAIHALSKGYPRLINILCDHALLCGYSANLQAIDGGVVKDCSRDLTVALGLDDGWKQLDPAPLPEQASGSVAHEAVDPPGHGWRPLIYIAVAVVVTALAQGWFYLK